LDSAWIQLLLHWNYISANCLTIISSYQQPY
jgi:hypothetical protein